MDTFGKRIDYLLKKSGMRVPGLSNKINVPSSTIYDYIKDKKANPRAKEVYSIAKYFDVSVEWLLTGIENNNESKNQGIIVNEPFAPYHDEKRKDYNNPHIPQLIEISKMLTPKQREKLLKVTCAIFEIENIIPGCDGGNNK